MNLATLKLGTNLAASFIITREYVTLMKDLNVDNLQNIRKGMKDLNANASDLSDIILSLKLPAIDDILVEDVGFVAIMSQEKFDDVKSDKIKKILTNILTIIHETNNVNMDSESQRLGLGAMSKMIEDRLVNLSKIELLGEFVDNFNSFMILAIGMATSTYITMNIMNGGELSDKYPDLFRLFNDTMKEDIDDEK